MRLIRLVRAHVSERWSFAALAGGGVALLVWTVCSVGFHALGSQIRGLISMLPFVLMLAATRFLLQAGGWRLAMGPTTLSWREAFGAVVAGEAVGYFGWGPLTREPMKVMLIRHKVPEGTALRAALVERVLLDQRGGTCRGGPGNSRDPVSPRVVVCRGTRRHLDRRPRRQSDSTCG
jgi:hypothetical protein